MGPTASGKTSLALRLHDYLSVDIINVDASQVYTGMDIGTAKPGADVLARVPHRLINIRDPAQAYSAAEFVADARHHIGEITAAGRIPLLVGGSMLYFRALIEGLADLPPANPGIRAQIEAQADEHGWPYMHQLLASVDAQTAATLHPNHSQRIARALEVFRVGGIPLSQLIAAQQRGQSEGRRLTDDYRVVQLALMPLDRQALHRVIERRFLEMLAAGLIDEVRQLLKRGDLSTDLPSVRAVGYRQIWGYLTDDYGYDEMVQKGIAATRQLAKRQLTWLRRWPDAVYLDSAPGDPEQAVRRAFNSLQAGEDVLTKTLNYLRKAAIYFGDDE